MTCWRAGFTHSFKRKSSPWAELFLCCWVSVFKSDRKCVLFSWCYFARKCTYLYALPPTCAWSCNQIVWNLFVFAYVKRAKPKFILETCEFALETEEQRVVRLRRPREMLSVMLPFALSYQRWPSLLLLLLLLFVLFIQPAFLRNWGIGRHDAYTYLWNELISDIKFLEGKFTLFQKFQAFSPGCPLNWMCSGWVVTIKCADFRPHSFLLPSFWHRLSSSCSRWKGKCLSCQKGESMRGGRGGKKESPRWYRSVAIWQTHVPVTSFLILLLPL